jgi:4-amino-4-deoxy-L-arabinose transferase-like glycosyltransferase
MLDEHPEIVKADPGYRRRLFSFYLTAIALGFIAWRFLLPPCIDAFDHLRRPAYFIIAESAVIVLLLVFIIPAVFLIQTGNKIIRSERFPFPGMKIMRDTKVVTGSRALFRGRFLKRLGYVSIGFAVAGSVAMHILFIYIRNSPVLSRMPLF